MVQGEARRGYLPSLLTSEALVEKSQHLGDAKLHVFQIELFLAVFLHFQKIVELEIKLQEAAVTSCEFC